LKQILAWRLPNVRRPTRKVPAINFGAKVEKLEVSERDVDAGRIGSLTLICHSKLEGAV
jgi:hypothetical protein